MSKQTHDAREQHLLLLVESAQRAGLSEAKIGELVDEAVETDAEFDRTELDRAA